MKNVKFLVLLFVAVSVGFVACKKDKKEDDSTQLGENLTIKTPSGKSCVLNKASYGADEYSTLEYDGQNRIVKANYFYKGALAGYSTYTYSNNEIILGEYARDGTLAETITYKLTNGRVTSSSSTYVERYGGFTYTHVKNTTFVYDNEGYLTKRTSVSNNSSTDPNSQAYTSTDVDLFTYQNGNLVTQTETYSNSQQSSSFSSTTTFEYYLDKANTLANEEEIFIKSSKNLVKKTTTVSVSGGQTESYVSNFTYDIDSDGLVNKKTETSSNYTDVTNFQYNCK